MQIIILSDIHISEDLVQAVLKRHEKETGAIIFCGDGLALMQALNPGLPLYAVKGNCDRGNAPLSLEFQLSGFRFFLTHGHIFQVKNGLSLLKQRTFKQPFDFVLFGHTHQPYREKIKHSVFFNPGALCEYHYGLLTLFEKDYYLEHCQIK
ncbi:MAG: metallophosphoesterase [Spirochaetae bacterium HGW-Spirochaetae-6]|nr:MAG: metallophosphoesterase [Spirochaetae bacterium HGW-Spirochaetae-6]